MSKKVTVLVGNGFNYFISQYLLSVNPKILLEKLEPYKKSQKITDQQVLIQLENLQNDIKRYCNLLDFLKLDNYSEFGETLLSKLNTFFEGLDKSNSSSSQNIVDELSSLVAAQINSIFDETSISKDVNHFKFVNATVKTLMKSGSNYFSENFLDFVNKVSGCSYNVYTTNYDYMIGSVFSEVYNTTQTLNFKEGGKVYNLHGHYARKDEHGEVVCCAPELKKEQMKKDYFEKFRNDVETSNLFILFGIGLTSDPHLLRELNKKENDIFIIIDSNKESYFSNHYPKYNSFKQNDKEKSTLKEFQFLKNNQIYFIDTCAYQSKENFLVNQINTPEKLIESLNIIADSLI
ncbi:MAG: hypothetical protein RSD40_02885 [Bacilli bacterium]|uniref:hypothetical protein n=1 Tax=Carnobacterium sp. TaxID=48221 RepID=UPI002FC98CEB